MGNFTFNSFSQSLIYGPNAALAVAVVAYCYRSVALVRPSFCLFINPVISQDVASGVDLGVPHIAAPYIRCGPNTPRQGNFWRVSLPIEKNYGMIWPVSKLVWAILLLLLISDKSRIVKGDNDMPLNWYGLAISSTIIDNFICMLSLICCLDGRPKIARTVSGRMVLKHFVCFLTIITQKAYKWSEYILNCHFSTTRQVTYMQRRF